jgi:hypothetical protein
MFSKNGVYRIIILINIVFQTQLQEIVDWDTINLPNNHLPFYFQSNPHIKNKCNNDDFCPFKEHLNSTYCYGYEKHCKEKDRLILSNCTGLPRVPWVCMFFTWLN